VPRLLIKIELDDIKTYKLGDNFLIQGSDNIDIIITPKALKELITDCKTLSNLDPYAKKSDKLDNVVLK